MVEDVTCAECGATTAEVVCDVTGDPLCGGCHSCCVSLRCARANDGADECDFELN